MQVEKVNRNEIPPGARILTEDEAFEEYWKFIEKKVPESVSWPFVWGIPLLGIASFTTNHTLLNHYRTRLKMGRKGLILWSLIFAALPSTFAPYGHYKYVTRDIILQKSCLLCLQTRAFAIQLTSAFAYSLTVTPLICFLQADSYGTYNVPGYYTKEQRLKMLELYLKFTKRASTKLYVCLLMNTAAATIIMGFEVKSFQKINQMMMNLTPLAKESENQE